MEGDFPNDIYGPRHDQSDKPESERHYFVEEINHGVVLIGWDVADDGTPLWIIQNSWGSNWNEDGTFKIARGFNAYGVESSPSVAYWREKGAVQHEDAMLGTDETHNLDDEDNTTIAIFGTLLGISLAAVALLLVLIVIKKFIKK